MIDVDWQGAAPEPDRRPPTLAELVDAIDSTRAAGVAAARNVHYHRTELTAAEAAYTAAEAAHAAALEQYRLHRTQAGIGAEQP